MLKFSICVPDDTINYIQNPQLRYDTNGWNTQGSALSRILTRARFGIASLQVTTNGSVLREGVYYRVSNLSGVNEPITVSAYVRGTGTVRIRLDNNVVGGTEFSSDSVELRADRWRRISVSGFSTGGNDLRLFIETNEASAVVRTFYVAGAQLERKAYMTTYCDGDQDGCRWNGTYHDSTSSRSTATRAGGKWVQLAGDDRVAQDLYMTVVGGLGVAPITNNIQPFALEPGSYFQNNKINARPITLTFFAKHEVDDICNPVTLAALHQLRQLLIDVVKPDRTNGSEDILFEYLDGDMPLYFRARYDGGLEGEWDIRNQFVNSFPLRLLAVSPFLEEDSQESNDIDFQESFSNKQVAQRFNGKWDAMNFGLNGAAFSLTLDARGRVYAVGTFTVANNSASAVAPNIPAVVAYYDGTKWVALASFYTGSAINSIVVAPNGDVYVAGAFTAIQGVAANRIAKYTASTGLWSALGTGLNGNGSCLAIASNGDVYVGGTFTTAGGVACTNIARWDGSTWRRVGQYGGLNNVVLTIAITQDGTRLYVGGTFTSEAAGAMVLNLVAQYNTATGLFSAMGSGFTGSDVRRLIILPSGIIYAGGLFSASSLASMNNIAQWNGSTWLPLGSGVDGEVYSIDYFSDGTLVATGQFNNSGNIPLPKIGIWNGSTWGNLDIYYALAPNDNFFWAMANRITGDLYLGGNSFVGTLAVYISGITTVTNSGTADVQPSLYMLGPGTLRWLENQTTQKRIYLNLIALNGEEIFFDFSQGTVFSTIRGNLTYGLLSGSDFGDFDLRPGDNTIAAFMLNDVSARLTMQFTPRHWSADATQKAEIV